jgi:hypothetical protein
MTPQQAADGLIEVIPAEGGRVLVDFHDGAAGDPEIEAAIIQVMMNVEGGEGDICAAVQEYAEASGLTATFFLGSEDVIVAVGSAETPGNPSRVSPRAAGRRSVARSADATAVSTSRAAGN